MSDQPGRHVALQAARDARDEIAEQWGAAEQGCRHESACEHYRQAGQELQAEARPDNDRAGHRHRGESCGRQRARRQLSPNPKDAARAQPLVLAERITLREQGPPRQRLGHCVARHRHRHQLTHTDGQVTDPEQLLLQPRQRHDRARLGGHRDEQPVPVQPVEGRRNVGHVAGTAHDEHGTAGEDGSLYQKAGNFHPPAAPRSRARPARRQDAGQRGPLRGDPGPQHLRRAGRALRHAR